MKISKPLLLALALILTYVGGFLCIIIFKRSQQSKPSKPNNISQNEVPKKPSDESQQAKPSLVFSDSENSVALCEFLTSCSTFKEAVKRLRCTKKGILGEIQTFLQEDADLVEKEKIGTHIGQYLVDRVDLSLLANAIEGESKRLIPQHFSFNFRYSVRHACNLNAELKGDGFIFIQYSKLPFFRENSADKKYPKFVDEVIKQEYERIDSYNSHTVVSINYPQSLIFEIEQENINDKIETHFEIPHGIAENKALCYRIKAVLVRVNGILKVMKPINELKIEEISEQDSKGIMETAEFILYERE
ncbi:hypothetical protein ENBRE01_0509 [Enteropsectra breve]|nr:hypothetical protein ENBRE01_0509 [Enteropsectra breve]